MGGQINYATTGLQRNKETDRHIRSDILCWQFRLDLTGRYERKSDNHEVEIWTADQNISHTMRSLQALSQ